MSNAQNTGSTVDKLTSIIDVLAMTASGATPAGIFFHYTQTALEKGLLKVAKDDIPEFEDATIEIDYNTGSIYGYVWLDRNSSNLRDNHNSNSNDTAVKVEIRRFSQVMENFIKKYSPDGFKQVVDNKEKTKCAVVVDIAKYLAVEHDMAGVLYKKKHNANPPKTKLDVEAIFDSKKDGRFTKFSHLKVTISLRNNVNSDRPRPVRSFGQ